MAKFSLEIIGRGESWTDPEFRPVFTSLFKEGTQEEEAKFKELDWKRVSEIYDSP